jgi:hypothetical protein
MVDMTIWDLWRQQGPYGKLLFIYIGALLLIGLMKATRQTLATSPDWVRWSDWAQRASISALMLCVTYTIWYSGKILSGETIADETKERLGDLILRQEIILFKAVAIPAACTTLLFFIGWIVRVIAARSKAQPAGV